MQIQVAEKWWGVKVSALSGEYSWSYSNRQQEEKKIDLYRKINYRGSLNRLLVQQAIELGLVSVCSL